MIALLKGLKTISPEKLHEAIQKREVIVFDVNSHDSWVNARVPGATNLDPNNYSIRDLPADKNSSLVFYCANPMCRKAPNAAARARKMGYTNIRVMSAGIRGWVSNKMPTESGE